MRKIKIMIIMICIVILILFGLLMYTMNIGNDDEVKVSSQNTVENSTSKEEQTVKDDPISDKNFYTVMYTIETYAGDGDLTFVPLNIRLNSGIYVDKYLVDGYFVNKDYKVIERMYLYVNLDNSNKTYSIEKLDKDSIDFENVEIENSDKSIQKSIKNSFSGLYIDESYIVKKCFNYLKINLIVYNKYIYQNLDEEYKKTKFSDEETYKQYIASNLEKYKKMEILKYIKEDYHGKVRYILINNYYDSYVYTNEDNYMKYSIMLDNYTIITDNMQEEYNKSSVKKKVYTNTENFLNMINNKDYETAYKVLDDEYKEENFPTLDSFKKYIQEKFYDYNIIGTKPDVVEGEEEGQYMWVFTLKDSVALSANEKEITIIIILGENMDYTVVIRE